MKKFRNDGVGFDIFIEKVKIRFFNELVEIDRFVVKDTFSFWQTDCEYEMEEQALSYVEDLLSCTTKHECNFYRWCAKDGLREGSVIQFEDGSQGVILGKEHVEACLKYSPIKKDGGISKLKRNLYGNVVYEIIKY